MAAMDFSLKRDDRGMSVFWMILIMGAGVFAIMALVLLGGDADGPGEYAEDLVEESGAQVVVTEGGEIVTGSQTSQALAQENDNTFLDDDVTVSGPQPEGSLSVEAVDVDVAPGDSPAILDAEVAAGTLSTPDEGVVEDGVVVRTVDIDDGVEGVGGGVQLDQEDVVVDPDGTTAPFVPTPSGPEGDDDDALTVD